MKDIMELSKIYNDLLYKISRGGVLSHFLPEIENGRITERAFIRNQTAGVNRRPYAWIGIDSINDQLLFYKHCALEDFMDTEQFPPNTEFNTIFMTPRSASEQVEKEKALLEKYRTVREFAFASGLNDSQKEDLISFKCMWDDTIISGLQPYYEALSPGFFQWIQCNI